MHLALIAPQAILRFDEDHIHAAIASSGEERLVTSPLADSAGDFNVDVHEAVRHRALEPPRRFPAQAHLIFDR